MCKARAFVMALREVLPCPACREHFEAHVKNMGFPRSVKRFGRWMYDLHERVNASLGKEGGVSFTAVRERWHSKQSANASANAMDFQALGLWKFLLSVVEAHPGKQAVTDAYIKASKDFWCMLAEVLPDSMMDAKEHLRSYLTKHSIAFDEGILVSRTKYKEWVERLYKEFEGREISARLDKATEAKCGAAMCGMER